MFDKIEVFDKRYEELNNKLYDPDVAANAEKYNSVMKELREIEPIVLKYREYKKAAATLDEAKQMLDENTDSEFKELLAEEIEAAKADIDKTSEELKILLLPKDPNDSKNVIIEIRAGAGGEESALFCYNLFRMYGMYAEKHGFKTEPIYINETELGGFKEVSFMLIGQGAYSRMKFESGVHRVQRVPETESQGRIHTSTATVAVLPEAEDVEYEINPADLKFDTFRSSGAGGQHINKTSSAVRVTHIPTGTVVECQEERSQFQNREKAVRVLKARLLSEKQQAQQSSIAAQRKAQVGTGERNERIRTYNYPQGRVTDHRIGLTLYKLDDILNGDLDEIIDALITADRAKQLASSHCALY